MQEILNDFMSIMFKFQHLLFRTPELYKYHRSIYLFKTFVYNLVYIPFPGPPALNEPPPPIIMLSTHIAIKSLSWCEQPSSPIITWDKTGKPAEANWGILHSS